MLFYFCEKDEDVKNIREDDKKIFECFRSETVKAILQCSTRFTLNHSSKKDKEVTRDYLDIKIENLDFNKINSVDICIDILLRELVYLRDIILEKSDRPFLFKDTLMAERYISKLEELVNKIITEIDLLAKSEKIKL